MKLSAVLSFAAFALLLMACDGDEASEAEQTPTAMPVSFPVVLDPDVRIAARADGSGLTEEPLTPPDGVFLPPGASPDRSQRVLVQDGRVVIESTAGDSTVIVDVATQEDFVSAVWSEDGARLVFDAVSGSSASLYVVNGDGTALVDVGTGLPGDTFPLAWSRDGQTLAFGFSPRDASTPLSALYVVRADGAARREIGVFSTPQGDAGWDPPKFSPDGSKFLAFGADGGIGGLRVFDLAGAPPLELPANGVLKFDWSADGEYVAYDSLDEERRLTTISVADATSGAVREITEGAWPRWSPAENRIAFKRRTAGSGEEQIHTVHADGGPTVALAPPGSYTWTDLSWSDDGSEVHFTRAGFGVAHLYRVGLADSAVTKFEAVLGEAGDPPQAASLSPDERLIAFPTSRGWRTVDLESGAETLLAEGQAGFGSSVHWTPQGPRVAVAAADVFVTDPGGGEPRALGVGLANDAGFSPDGGRLAVLAQHQLIVAAADGPERIVLYNGVPQAEIVQFVQWAPDGVTLAYAVSRTGISSYDVYVTDLDGAAERLEGQPGELAMPRWSPDGSATVLVKAFGGPAGAEVWLGDERGRRERLLATFGETCCGEAIWSPDGRLIALVNNLNHDVYVIDAESGRATYIATTGGACSVALAGWSSASDALYMYPACYFGV